MLPCAYLVLKPYLNSKKTVLSNKNTYVLELYQTLNAKSKEYSMKHKNETNMAAVTRRYYIKILVSYQFSKGAYTGISCFRLKK